ncbi:MAG: DUF2183 domain-containing protein [Planctomycetes bacterium]|nr:DUF2183 domain-containing protein [Planctomycetota bacterium]
MNSRARWFLLVLVPVAPTAAQSAGAARIDELQRGPTGESGEREIVRILSDAEPLERARFLRIVDQGNDGYDLDHLAYHDVDDPVRRDELLALIDDAGKALAAAGGWETGVVSDIDETLLSAGLSPIPGASELLVALDEGADGKGEPGDVHYVTARPRVATGGLRERLASEGFPAGTFEEGKLRRFLASPRTWFDREERDDEIEEEKVADVLRLFRLHPGQSFVLVGDDRERDPEVYARILAEDSDRAVAVVIRRTHEARGRGLPSFPDGKAVVVAEGESYAVAARFLSEKGILSEEQVGRVETAAGK